MPWGRSIKCWEKLNYLTVYSLSSNRGEKQQNRKYNFYNLIEMNLSQGIFDMDSNCFVMNFSLSVINISLCRIFL